MTKLAHGRVLMERGEVVFAGASLSELLQDFKRALDAYLARCEQMGLEPRPPLPDLPDAPATSGPTSELD